ncbi:putative transporter YeaB [Siminovitchia terrae]|uniref:Cation transporter n=1 Tax=Siminovitchia terrae TaxID=1914933 RepID=A0A429XCU7_SIMTE|nr:cation diffusion facilitator family transporter [Siminovitchia terrae]RST61286.1 cation transporter [Siminovitchia terrae]GIN89207.1 putative transporter YeaB [Siminovitchia terrae]GIN95272.1 putative transporter YeaB [Siminovitchia terrae]
MVRSSGNDLKMGERGAILSIFAYIFLSVLKLVIADMSNSAALRADGLNNATDIVASIAVLIGLRFSQKPADDNHPYGHWKAEMIATLVASFIMMVVGLQVLFEAVSSVFAENQESPDMVSALTAVFSSGIMYLVYKYNQSLGRKINSQAVKAAAKDNLSDAWVSIGAAIGIIGSQFGLPWLDPLTAVIVGFLICKTAWDIFRDASLDLTDGYDEAKLERYKESIFEISGVKGIKDIKARRYGNKSVVDVVILVNSTLGIQAAHQISDCVEEVLMKKHQVFDVHVHVEPN